MFRSALFIFAAALLTACNPSNGNAPENNATDSTSRGVDDLSNQKVAVAAPTSGQNPATLGPSVMSVDTPPLGGQLPADLMPPR